MMQLIKDNAYFFAGFGVFLLVGLLFLLQIDKGEAILFFNENRTPLGDFFFKYTTKLGEEPAYIVICIALLFVRYRYAILIPITGILVTICSFGLKSYFASPRPAAFFKTEGVWDTINTIVGVDLHTGATSFPSGHTMSGFALYALLAFIVTRKRGIGLLLFVVAFLVGFSRVYLVQHFWEDVYAGAIVGIVLGMAIFLFQKRISDNPSKWWNKRLLRKVEK